MIHPETNNLIVIETEYNAYTEATKMERKQQMAEVGSEIVMAAECLIFLLCLIACPHESISFINIRNWVTVLNVYIPFPNVLQR